MIYFIQAKDTDYVRICKASSGDFSKRLANLQLGCPYELIVIRRLEGSLVDLKYLQETYAPHRIRGEWYTLIPEMKEEDPPKSKTPIELIEALIEKGIFPSVRQIRNVYPGFPYALIKKLRPEIKVLTNKYYECTTEKVYEVLKQIEELSKTLSATAIKRQLNISNELFRHYEKKMQSFRKIV